MSDTTFTAHIDIRMSLREMCDRNVPLTQKWFSIEPFESNVLTFEKAGNSDVIRVLEESLGNEIQIDVKVRKFLGNKIVLVIKEKQCRVVEAWEDLRKGTVSYRIEPKVEMIRKRKPRKSQLIDDNSLHPKELEGKRRKP